MDLSFLHIRKFCFEIHISCKNYQKSGKNGYSFEPKFLKTRNSQTQKLLEALNQNPFKPDIYYEPKPESKPRLQLEPELDSNWDLCLYQMGMEMEREWRWTKMEIENRISSLYQSMVSDRDGNGDAKWGWG